MTWNTAHIFVSFELHVDTVCMFDRMFIW